MGGSLKERMAALQGKGAFGGIGGGGTPPPKPTSEKPKWKPPPKVTSPPPDESEGETPGADDGESIKSPPVPAERSSEDATAKDVEPVSAPEGHEDKEDGGEVDPEEGERQRRAAIAARMA